jgi:DNA-binding LacI/PurR family transcriptional regulator
VARAAGVSRGVVSQILNGHGQRFAEATRERVRQAALDLAYEPSAAGRALARGTTDLVVAVIPNTTFGSNLQDLFDVLAADLFNAGYTLVLHLSTSSVQPFDRLIASMRPAAVVAAYLLGDEERQVLTARRVLLVEPARPVAIEDDPNYKMGVFQADHLAERGHTRPVFAQLHDARQIPYGNVRLRGFQARCRQLWNSEPEVIGLGIDTSEAESELRRLGGPGAAVAAYNDEVALAVLAGAHRLGWSTPDDIAVMGMDDTPVGRVVSPRITTVAYDITIRAHEISRAVLATLRGEETWYPSPLTLKLVQGETT